MSYSTDGRGLSPLEVNETAWALKTLGLASQIKERRRALRWTQSLLAEKAGVSHQTVSKLERGRCNPTADTIANIAQSMGLFACIEFLPFHMVKSRAAAFRANMRQDQIEEKYPEGLTDVLERSRW